MEIYNVITIHAGGSLIGLDIKLDDNVKGHIDIDPQCPTIIHKNDKGELIVEIME